MSLPELAILLIDHGIGPQWVIIAQLWEVLSHFAAFQRVVICHLLFNQLSALCLNIWLSEYYTLWCRPLKCYGWRLTLKYLILVVLQCAKFLQWYTNLNLKSCHVPKHQRTFAKGCVYASPFPNEIARKTILHRPQHKFPHFIWYV